MPLDSNHNLHTWMKNYKHHPERMPSEPDNHDLLGFPGVESEHPKWYIRRLWLVAEDPRIAFPKFLDKDVRELAVLVNKVVNTVVKDDDKRHEELSGDSFLEKDAARILDDKGFGWRIWGQHPDAETRLKSNLPGTRPRWGIKMDSGYEKNDEDNIRLNLRYWMAARIQAKMNTPSKDRKHRPSKTMKHIEQISLQLAPRLCHLRPEHEGSPELSALASTLSPQHHTCLSETLMGSTRSSKRAHTDDSDSSFSFGPFLPSDPEPDFPQSRSRRSKRLRSDISTRGSQTRSPQIDSEATFTMGASLLSHISTNLTIPDARNVNNNDINTGGLSSVDQIKQKLGLDLARFLNNELDFAGILREVIPPTRHLYGMSPHRKPCSDFEFEFKNFNRALEYWESLITRLTASSGVTHSPLDDPLQELAAQQSFENRVAMLHNCGPISQIDFPLERWTIFLALFFEGLLGDTYMPLPFDELVVRLRAANQPLYDAVAVAGD
ncbi:hypothetical protein DPSP01_014372 [Paraphaeosphaeria sporulosa]